MAARQRPGPGVVLSAYQLAWHPVAWLVRRTDPQVAHARTIRLLRGADRSRTLAGLAGLVNHLALPARPTWVGGVRLPHPVILAAGLVKGDGFASEAEALAAVAEGRNIIPGWRSLARLVGAVEIGSFTRQTRVGNGGRVLWRDMAARSMQNRVGLRNPGAVAAAEHLSAQGGRLPRTWGVSLAASPGLHDPELQAREVADAARVFELRFRGHPAGPSWYTLNLSCPNTEDDPRATQTREQAGLLASALTGAVSPPVWVKISPCLSDRQLEGIVEACLASGARAVVATNTQARPTPDRAATAGLSGAPLRPLALDTVSRLRTIIGGPPGRLDIIGSGGILGGSDLLAFRAAGSRAVMIYSALVFRGPLAAALILREAREAERGDRGA